ncbi:MAG: sporulation integral membrane protein YtvI [Oscillospiraceae bacterium]|nr:sporulation integral membrane protein YtvI [Oscillospiraceae bacterium]
MQVVEKRRQTIINVIYFGMIIAFAAVMLRYAVGICMPFIIAFVFAAILQKPKNFLVRKTPLKKGLASAICVLLALVLIALVFSLIGARVFDEIKGFIDYLVLQFKDLETLVDKVETWFSGVIASLPEFLEKSLAESSERFFTKLRESINGESAELTQQITSGIAGKFNMSWISTPLNGVISTARQLPNVFVAVIITIVSSCFLTSDFQRVMDFIKLQFPEKRRTDLTRAKAILKDSLGKMGKAYLIIMLITFVEMSVGLTVLRLIGVFESNYIVLIGAATAIIDIVPLLGTGTVIFPWALYCLIMKDYGMAIGLVIIYVVISVIRQVIEPKLVAGQLGLSPIVTITAMYLGLKLFGFIGMFALPLTIIVLKLLNDEGIVNLWKSKDKEEKMKAAVNEEGTGNPPEEATKSDGDTAQVTVEEPKPEQKESGKASLSDKIKKKKK